MKIQTHTLGAQTEVPAGWKVSKDSGQQYGKDVWWARHAEGGEKSIAVPEGTSEADARRQLAGKINGDRQK